MTMLNQPIDTDQPAIPAEIDRWNWGAFLLNWIWGIGNKTFIALFDVHSLCRPGDALRARRQGKPLGMAQWTLGQRRAFPARATQVGDMGRRHLAWRDRAVRRDIWRHLLYSPTIRGLRTRRIPASGQPPGNGRSGNTDLDQLSDGLLFERRRKRTRGPQFSATGPKASGRVFLEAIKKDGVWSLTKLTLKVDGRDDVIDLINRNQDKVEIEDARPHTG